MFSKILNGFQTQNEDQPAQGESQNQLEAHHHHRSGSSHSNQIPPQMQKSPQKQRRSSLLNNLPSQQKLQVSRDSFLNNISSSCSNPGTANFFSNIIRHSSTNDPRLSSIAFSKIIMDELSFHMIAAILNKTSRNQNDLLILQMYLKSISQFTSLMEKSSYCKSIDNILYQIAVHIKYEKKYENSIICRQGDRGNKFYIVFKGKLSVLILKEQKTSMNYKNYVKYLIYLKKIKEEGIFSKVLQINSTIYHIEEKDIEDFIIELDNGGSITERGINKVYKTNLSITLDEIIEIKYFYKDKFEEELKYSSVNDYIQHTAPQQGLTDLSKYSHEISTYIYHEITKKNQGDCFGEIALFQGNTRRTATIFCLEDCIFGSLSREVYTSTIKDIQNRIRKNNVQFLLRYKLFSELNYAIFESKFFNFFIEKKLTQGQCLITQGFQRNDINFIRDGEFELITHQNNIELNMIIQIKNGKAFKVKKSKGNIKMISKNNDEESKVKLIQRKYRIAIVHHGDVIGFDDLVVDNVFLCTAVCRSPTALIYSIELPILIEIQRKIPRVKRDMDIMLEQRQQILISRLRQLLEYGHAQEIKVEAKNKSKTILLKLFNENHTIIKDNNINNTKCKTRISSAFQLSNQTKEVIHPIIQNTEDNYIKSRNTQIEEKGNCKHSPLYTSYPTQSFIRNNTLNTNNEKQSEEIEYINTNQTHTLSNTNIYSPTSKRGSKMIKSNESNSIKRNKRDSLVAYNKNRGESSYKSINSTHKILKRIIGSVYKERQESIESKRLFNTLTMCHDDQNSIISNFNTQVNDSSRQQKVLLNHKRNTITNGESSNNSNRNRRAIVDFLLYDNYVNPTLVNHNTFLTQQSKGIKYFTPKKGIPVNYINKVRPLRMTCLKKTVN